MLIIWSGFGILVPVLGFAGLLLTQLAINGAFHGGYYQTHGWAKILGALVGAGAIYLLSLWLDRQPSRVVIDKATGRELALRKRHSFFFIPARYWPYIFLALGVAFLFA